MTVARENVAKNRMAQRIAVEHTPVGEIATEYDLILANIVHDVLVELAPTLIRLTAPGGALVLAGILAGPQEENILAVYDRLGCRLRQRQHQDEWAALLLERS